MKSSAMIVGTALQATLLYMLLCFSPQTLHNDGQLMRTLVDRHFSDTWIIAWGHEMLTDLSVEWEHFRAARLALMGVVTVSRVRDIGEAIKSNLPEVLKQLAAHNSKAQVCHVLQASDNLMLAALLCKLIYLCE